MNPNWFYSIQLILRRSQWQQPRVEGEARDKVCPASVKWINQPKPSQERVKGTSGSSRGQRGKPGTKARQGVKWMNQPKSSQERGKGTSGSSPGQRGSPGERAGNCEMNQSAKTPSGSSPGQRVCGKVQVAAARDKGGGKQSVAAAQEIINFLSKVKSPAHLKAFQKGQNCLLLTRGVVVRVERNKSKNTGITSVDRSTKATLSTYNPWIQVSRLQKIYHFQHLKLRFTQTSLTRKGLKCKRAET